jgi:flagellar hook-basal body complex protein FliE
MSKIKEIIVDAVLPAIKEIGKLEMEAVLTGIKNKQTAEAYKNLLQSLYSGFSLLKEASVKSKTKIDDGIVDIVLRAVERTASKAEISLSI